MKTIGIIGGGQLGRMLAMAAARLSLKVVILEPDANCPAAQVANRVIVAPYDDEAALDALAEACDVVTYEFENVPLIAATRLARRLPVYPPPKALEVSQDRLVEKRFLNGCGLDTARYHAIDSLEALQAGLEDFGGHGILKTRRFGYDGKGQLVLKPEGLDIEAAFAELGGVPLILESFVPFIREISIIAARSIDGAISAFDPAENIHRDGILSTSRVPANVDVAIMQAARSAAASILTALDYVGVIGVEFFVLASGKLAVNEIAPRVHNSGHWTEAACLVSQFEQHMRAVAGLPLGQTRRHSDCLMHNLIGDDIDRVPDWLATPDALLHLYGKDEARPGRKMGHVTVLSPR
ncbi:5-(carboxyamino)imidazole ribonucleotide synthase [Xaviernesmea oryzae]|nr:5-(carboxyamino)imidazole ribonucleotide synthase [Xaviernesmea oryzae]SEL15111.1 5-(carboxyamino)imidazole ribonucleotide synthase [Xaviernesmea oryzae]